ncbi:uncharacterized protein LOC111921560 isoform X2 [Lactuca sativa]|uniref:uncharacterized protein LOC111921560 isoform X2 n=1 Tax=Lactuca sativa TaxID=4236 RepID=UPI0022AE758B|nr:uncharacterized protein LOC111921560 isoform X2 [Lactuca sativa]
MKHRRAGLFWHLSCCEIQQPHAALQTRFPVPRAVKSPSPWAIQETLVVRSQAFQLTTKEARAAPNVVTGNLHRWISVFRGPIGVMQCKKQQMLSTSTAKVEYVAATTCCSQVIWI